MESVLLLFDRFRDAWHLNRANKSLYWPQVALTLVRVLITLGAGAGFYAITSGSAMARFLSIPSWHHFLPVLSPMLLLVGGVWLALLLAGVIIEAGLFNMYKEVVLTGTVTEGSFAAGVARFALPFILGDLLLLVIVLVTMPLWLLVGGLTLTVGFGLISLIWGVALMMWKVALVREELGLVAAIKASVRFALENKLAITLLFLIRQSFLKLGGSSPTPNFNWQTGSGDMPQLPDMPFFRQHPVQIFQTVIVVITVLAAFAVAAWSLVQMLFHVFFGLVMFLVWEQGLTPREVSTDVV